MHFLKCKICSDKPRWPMLSQQHEVTRSIATPPDWDASPSQANPDILSGCPNSLPAPIKFILLGGEMYSKSEAPCPSTQQNDLNQFAFVRSYLQSYMFSLNNGSYIILSFSVQLKLLGHGNKCLVLTLFYKALSMKVTDLH